MRTALTMLTLMTLQAPTAPVDRDPGTAGHQVEEVTIEAGDAELAGRLWLPPGPGPHPAVAFLPGSGRSIRDLGLDPDPVPYHFLERGIAFLAWDKRGVRDSGGEFVPLPDRDTEAQLARLRLLASDAAAALRHLAGREDIDAGRVGAWAFSQGGWVASQLREVGAAPRFLIIVGGPAVSIGEELRYSDFARAAREASRGGGPRVDMDAVYARLEEARRAEGDFGGYDPLPYLESFETPTLFLLGEDDLSVPTRRSVERLRSLGRRNERIDHRVFPRANHGVATTDAAGVWHMAEDFYATQFEFLANLGVLEHRISVRTAVDRAASGPRTGSERYEVRIKCEPDRVRIRLEGNEAGVEIEVDEE